MFENLPLLAAPDYFVPACNLEHCGREIHQTFPNGRVKLVLDLANSEATATVDNRVVSHWDNVTIGKWSDILYTLTEKFAHEICNPKY